MELLAPERSYDGIASTGPLPDVSVARTSGKAPPGTVKPAILNLIETSSGLLTEQIVKITGFKENSVRGTISALSKEGKIRRNGGGHWIKKSETAPLLGETVPNG
jgi:hypothetical protein